MNITEALTQLHNQNLKELDIYWLEKNEECADYWWCDVVNDDIVKMCQFGGWVWTVMSRAEYENEEPEDSTGKEEDWFIIVDEEKFSEDPYQRLITLKTMIGPVDIDDPNPAITIMLPNED